MWIIWALLFLVALWLLLAFANRRYDLKKRGVTIEPGVVMWRTKRGLKFIDRIAKISEGGWRAFGSVAAAAGIFFMVTTFIGVAVYAMIVLQAPEAVPAGVRFAIPGITIPLWAPLVAIATLLVVHETAHGILLRAQKLQTKSVGGLLLVAIPGAFVEPDEKQLNRSPVPKRLRVFGAGSFANILFAFACVGLILLFLTPRPGVYISGIVENSPAENVLLPGDRLLQMGNIVDDVVTDVVTINDYQDFSNFMEGTQKNDNVTVWIERGGQEENFRISLIKHPRENKGFLGVATVSATPRSNFANPFFTIFVAVEEFRRPQVVFHPYAYDAYVPWSVIELLKWMFILNLLIGLFNLLPAKPLDGGYMVAGLVEWKTSAKTGNRVARALSILVLVLLIVNITPMFLG
jgi:membrane-associated protease RseP (regulator of RpoE activity)